MKFIIINHAGLISYFEVPTWISFNNIENVEKFVATISLHTNIHVNGINQIVCYMSYLL